MNGREQDTLSGRSDFQAIAAWVRPDSTVLDLGCGDGTLLKYLNETRNARGYGIDIDDANVLACVKNGVNVIQSDLERGLAGFDAGSFDCVILSQTLQAVRRTEEIILEMLRVGREAIVSFPTSAAGRAAADRTGTDARVTGAALPVVQHAQRAPLHHRRFRVVLRWPRHSHPRACRTEPRPAREDVRQLLRQPRRVPLREAALVLCSTTSSSSAAVTTASYAPAISPAPVSK